MFQQPGSSQPMPTGQPGAEAGNVAVMQLRKALGLPENQPAPEQKVIAAVSGALGPELKRMAMAVGQQDGMKAPAPGDPATSPDPSQAGGAAEPPDPNAPDTASAPSVQPGAGSAGKMGASAIFGRGGDQPSAEDDEDGDDQMPRSGAIFGRR